MPLPNPNNNKTEVAQLKSMLATVQHDNKKLQAENVSLQAKCEAIQEQLTKALKKIEWLQEQIELFGHRQFGKHSETSQSLKLPLFDEEQADEVEEQISALDEQTEQICYSRRKRNGSRRNIDTRQLPRETVVHSLSVEEQRCACGHQMQPIGEDKSEKIDYIPAQVKVIEHITLKYACKACERIKSAKRPEFPLQKSMATSNFIVDVVIKKYDEHLPLYRQSKILERDGIAILDSTLGNWVMAAAEGLSALGKALWQQISFSGYLQADETKVKILKPDKMGYMWLYQGLDPNNRFITCEFDLSRAARVAKERLKNFSGLLQTDGYCGYTDIGKQDSVIHLGCWDHSRRKFVDADKVCGNQGKGIAAEFIQLINQLYKIEQEITHASDEKRYQLRQEKAKPILDSVFKKAKQINALPKSTLATAITYLKNNESKLRRYIDYGKAHISNCLTENRIRPFAVGRRNWLFVGNHDSANKSALLYSLIQTCKINSVNVRKYLTYVLNQVHAMRRGEVDPTSLLPQFINPDILN